MDNYQSCKKIFDRDGFVMVHDFLTKTEVGELQSHLARFIRERVPTLPDTHAFYQDKARPETLKQMQFMEKVEPYFLEYCQHPKWNALAETLLGEPIASRVPNWFNKPPLTDHPTPPHQDNYYARYDPCSYVMIWLALDDVDDENGCLSYIPGSHKGGFRPHSLSSVLGFSQGITDFGPKDEAIEVKIHLRPGGVVAHHGMAIHRANPNKSATRNRRAFAMGMRGVSCKVDEAAYAQHQKEVAEQHKKLGIKSS